MKFKLGDWIIVKKTKKLGKLTIQVPDEFWVEYYNEDDLIRINYDILTWKYPNGNWVIESEIRKATRDEIIMEML